MSKRTGSATDSANDEVLQTSESVGTAENPTTENSAAEIPKAKSAKGGAKAKPKKYGLERFLQLYPQSSYIEAILRAFYANAIGTVEEWFAWIEYELNRPVSYKSAGKNKREV